MDRHEEICEKNREDMAEMVRQSDAAISASREIIDRVAMDKGGAADDRAADRPSPDNSANTRPSA